MTANRTLLLVAGLTIMLATSGIAMANPGAPGAGSGLAEVRQATAQYHDVSNAEADGYIPVSPCEASPQGGMGIHYLNPALFEDGAVDASQPEVLLYEPKKNGDLKLVGVEYFVNASKVSGAPSLFGQTFAGPMPGHGPGQPVHYELHVWTWQANPDGVFASWNPNVECPDNHA